MGIQTLPNSSIRAIGASQVLNDPASVVKELLDNALDARATSIAIEISSNTLDIIQVRDNGHGIPPEDRELVARPHCTSKITCMDDLCDIGGMSLGFRGEALASVAELSGSLTITTRVEGEQVAIGLKINQQGVVEGQERASSPVGTTVKITDFIKANPVRRQVALKDAEKCLKKIKHLLQSYAFARPHVRLSLRALKAKNDKGDWTYAPKAGGYAEDVAFKIVGAACASQCTWSVVEEQGFTLQAFLPQVDGDGSKVNNFGSFVSVDARPVSTARGTPKQIVKNFREALKKANAHFDRVKDPFIYLEIECPQASYDANVEPAKDDVLFENPDIVVSAARRLFAAVYPVPQSAIPEAGTIGLAPSRPTRVEPRVEPQVEEDDFTTSLETAPLLQLEARPVARDVSPSVLDYPPQPPILARIEREDPNDLRENPQRTFRTTMYGCDEEDLDFLSARPPTGHTEADFEELRQARKDVNLTNPWIMAKMNPSLRRPLETPDDEHAAAPETVSPDAPRREPQRSDRPFSELEAPGLPTPRPSSPSPPSQHLDLFKRVPNMRLTGDSRLIGSPSLPSPQALIPPTTLFSGNVESDVASQSRSRQQPAYDYALSSQALEPPMGTPLHAIPDVSLKPRRSPRKPMQQTQINKPFVQPVRDQPPREKVWFDHLENDDLRRQHALKKRPYQQRNSDGLVFQGELGDLIEDPRPLTPPRRNRDMREFVTPVTLTGTDSTAFLIESKNYPKPKGGYSDGNTDTLLIGEDEENVAPASSMQGARGFIPASELAAVQSHVGPLNEELSRPTKRRKSSDGRVVCEISGNVLAPAEGDDEEYRPMQASRKASRRRTTDGTKLRRSKSSRLPLERVPGGQSIHHLVFNWSTTMREVSRLAGKMDQERSLLGWSEPALDAFDTFAVPPSPADMRGLSAKLREVLINRISDREMVRDLGTLVQDAFAAHKRAAMDVEMV